MKQKSIFVQCPPHTHTHTHTRARARTRARERRHKHHKQTYIKCFKEHEWHKQNERPDALRYLGTLIYSELFDDSFWISKIFTESKEMVRRSVMGWQGRHDLESDVLICFNALPVSWFQTHKQPTKIPVRIVASLILTRFELRISKMHHQDSTHIWKVAPGRLPIIWWRSQYPQSQRTWSSKKYLQYRFNSIRMISPMF
jgi:hypothetical protein